MMVSSKADADGPPPGDGSAVSYSMSAFRFGADIAEPNGAEKLMKERQEKSEG